MILFDFLNILYHRFEILLHEVKHYENMGQLLNKNVYRYVLIIVRNSVWQDYVM